MEQMIIIVLLLIQLMITIYYANYRGESFAPIPPNWGTNFKPVAQPKR
jgi:hypothetical protein